MNLCKLVTYKPNKGCETREFVKFLSPFRRSNQLLDGRLLWASWDTILLMNSLKYYRKARRMNDDIFNRY